MHSIDQANIENLFPFTEYEARIVPFNSKGQGNASDVIVVKTKEAGKKQVFKGHCRREKGPII